jgi:hypothetical protein
MGGTRHARPLLSRTGQAESANERVANERTVLP